MNAGGILRKAWNDTVWSKVIAAGITAAMAAIFGASLGYWQTTAGWRAASVQYINAPVTVPAWLLVALGLLIIGLAFQSFRRRTPAANEDDDVQPNAIPVANVRIMDLR